MAEITSATCFFARVSNQFIEAERFTLASGALSATRFRTIPCSKNAFNPQRTIVKPPIESMTCSTIESRSPWNLEFVIVMKVSFSARLVKIHSTVVLSSNSMRIRLFCSTFFTSISAEKPYISQSHWTRLPVSNLTRLPFRLRLRNRHDGENERE